MAYAGNKFSCFAEKSKILRTLEVFGSIERWIDGVVKIRLILLKCLIQLELHNSVHVADEHEPFGSLRFQKKSMLADVNNPGKLALPHLPHHAKANTYVRLPVPNSMKQLSEF